MDRAVRIATLAGLAVALGACSTRGGGEQNEGGSTGGGSGAITSGGGSGGGGGDASIAPSADGPPSDGAQADATVDSTPDTTDALPDDWTTSTDSPLEGGAALLCVPYPVGVAQCGQLGGTCCPDSSCAGSAACVGSVCQPCGGGGAQICCPGNTCGPGVLCTCLNGETPTEEPCTTCDPGCGTVGQFCCQSDPGTFRCTQGSTYGACQRV